MNRKTVLFLIFVLVVLTLACSVDPSAATPTPVPLPHVEATGLVDALNQLAEPVEQGKSLYRQFCELSFTTCP
jgi:beta-lactam-binding protein with PASTA domain